MAPLRSHFKKVGVLTKHQARGDDGPACSNNAWDCLNTPAQFGIIFSIIVVVIAVVWIYWYTVIRPRRERIKESGEDMELDLGDGRTVIVSSGPHQRTVVFRDHRPPTPPPPAYRPPTPGGVFIRPSGFAATTESSQPCATREPHVQILPPRAPPQPPQTPKQAPPQSMNTSGFAQGYPFPGSYSQPIPFAMYPPQLVVPGPPPPPPAMMHPRTQSQTYFVIPPPPPPPPHPPPAPGMPAQGLIPPPPPPPPVQPLSGGSYQRSPGTGSQLRTRPPSPGHASTIEDDQSDRGGSLPPASRRGQSPSRGRSPPPGGSQFTRSCTPSPSERRRQHGRRRPRPKPSCSPPRGRRGDRRQHEDRENDPLPRKDRPRSDSPKSSDTSYRSSTSLDSELRTDLASLLLEAGGRQRAHEAERLQALVDRYDKEEEEERGHHKESEIASGEDKLPRLPGQPMRLAAQRKDQQGSHQRDEAYRTDNEGRYSPPKRHVAFHEPSLAVLESRVGRSSRPSQGPTRIPTREDLHHGESRVGRRRRDPSPDKRIYQRPAAPTLGGAESRIGRPQPSPPPREAAWHRDSHRFPGVGESRVSHHQGRKRRGTHPPETVSSSGGANYYNTHDGSHRGQPTADDRYLNIYQSEGPPSSAGATCATRSQTSSDSNDPRQRMGLTPSVFNRDRYQRSHQGAPPHLRSPSPEKQVPKRPSMRSSSADRKCSSYRSADDGGKNNSLKPSWGSKLASFLPTIARLATNNPVVREVADNIADEVRTQDRREQQSHRQPPSDAHRRPTGHGPHDDQQAARPRPSERHRGPRQRRDARRSRSQGPRRGASRQLRPSNNSYRSHGRRPSTIPEEPRESAQLALEHAAERLAEGAVESGLGRACHRGAGSGGHADVMPGRDDRRRRQSRSSRKTES